MIIIAMKIRSFECLFLILLGNTHSYNIHYVMEMFYLLQSKIRMNIRFPKTWNALHTCHRSVSHSLFMYCTLSKYLTRILYVLGQAALMTTYNQIHQFKGTHICLLNYLTRTYAHIQSHPDGSSSSSNWQNENKNWTQTKPYVKTVCMSSHSQQ